MSTTTPDAAPDPARLADPVRASDAEREAIVTRLHDALGEGRLDLPETETRVAAAYAARHRQELPPLLADLPGSSPRVQGSDAPTWTSIWTSIVWRLRLLLGGIGGGTPDGGATAPTAQQCRRAAVVVVLVVVWLVLCAAAGALVA